MYRIDSEGSDNGKFSNGDHTLPEKKEGTILDAEWLNTLQESICHVIEAQGIDLKKGDYHLLLEGIKRQIAIELDPIKKDLKKVFEILEVSG